MRLGDWVNAGVGRLSKLSRDTGCAYSTISNVYHGKCRPLWPTAQAISKATEGAVSVAEVYAHYEQARAQRELRQAAPTGTDG